jgi:hypothetical protein
VRLPCVERHSFITCRGLSCFLSLSWYKPTTRTEAKICARC